MAIGDALAVDGRGDRCVAVVTGGRCVHTCAGAHGLGEDLQLVRGGLVLHAAVVLEEELAGLLQNAPTLADGTEAQTERASFSRRGTPPGTRSDRDHVNRKLSVICL